MSQNVNSILASSSERHEQPFLYPWNHRLRHLQGVSVRNLDVSNIQPRPQEKPATDDDIPFALKSPARLLAENESRFLEHSRSSSDLRSLGTQSPLALRSTSTNYLQDDRKLKDRPSGRTRRRSTLHWSGASPLARQQKLEHVAESHMANSWFSLHAKDHDANAPLYISEVMERSMNPTFRFFDLDYCGPGATRLQECRLLLWTKTESTKRYSLLIDLVVHFGSLQFIGKSLENFHHPLPFNCVLFHFSDGIYTSFTDLPAESYLKGVPTSPSFVTDSLAPTSNFDALMQLANLDDCIQDAVSTRIRLEAQITALLMTANNDEAAPRTRVTAKMREIAMAVSAEQKGARHIRKRITELRAGLVTRRRQIAETSSSQEVMQENFRKLRREITEQRSGLGRLSRDSTGQIRRICEDLLAMFPIDALRNKTLQFSIRGIYLPNSVFDDTNRDEIAAALGMAARLVQQLAIYLSVPLPYPIELGQGDPVITDPVSIALTQRQFPLHPTTVAYKFEYGVFLLNKNVEFLMERAGVRVLDIRHTLPNLKYLLFVLTAGIGELPARKAGGIRGLFGGILRPSVSRRSSQDSVVSDASNAVRFPGRDRLANGRAKPSGMDASRETKGELPDPFLDHDPAVHMRRGIHNTR